MGFAFGFLVGLLAAAAGLGFLVHWVCTGPNNIAVARFVNAIAQAIASRHPKSREPRNATGMTSGARERNIANEEDNPNLS
jgi:hypothetical protein